MGKLRFRRVSAKGWDWLGGHKVDYRSPFERFMAHQREYYAAWHYVLKRAALND